MEDHVNDAQHLLQQNDNGQWVYPASELYPHQWLWDSSFIAIGLCHHDPERAIQEITMLMRGQWENGMLPHMIFAPGLKYWRDRWFWGSRKCPQAPREVATSGITQPPVITHATLKVSQTLPARQRDTFLRAMFPHLLAYHQWFYNERDPENDGLVALIHHWETGLDNTPDWMELLLELPSPWWLKLMQKTGLIKLVKLLRRDTRSVQESERMPTLQAIKSSLLALHYRRLRFNNNAILTEKRLAVESLFFNSILIRANRCLESIADIIGQDIPSSLTDKFRQAEAALEDLYDETSSMYHARNVATKTPMDTVSISSLMPLYAGCISQQRAEEIVRYLTDHDYFWPPYPVPSVPLNSPYFDEKRYWQGPAWVNTNWFIIDGLRQHGFEQEAQQLRSKTLAMVEQSGHYEYFSPLSGAGYGIHDFSWTAALYLDLKMQ